MDKKKGFGCTLGSMEAEETDTADDSQNEAHGQGLGQKRSRQARLRGSVYGTEVKDFGRIDDRLLDMLTGYHSMDMHAARSFGVAVAVLDVAEFHEDGEAVVVVK